MYPLVFLLHPHLHGWRWAIYWANRDRVLAEPLSRCVNAGFEPDQRSADLHGQDCLYTLLNFGQLTKVAQSIPVDAVTLDYDPIPPSALGLEAVQVSPNILQLGGN